MMYVTSEGERYIPDHIRVSDNPNKVRTKESYQRARGWNSLAEHREEILRHAQDWKRRHEAGESFRDISLTTEHYSEKVVSVWVRKIEGAA